jgi:hypothetical protein
MPALADRDGKVRIRDNTDTEVFTIPDSSGKTTYTSAATATTTVTAPTTTASFAAGTAGAATVVYGFTTSTQADAVVTAVNQIVKDMQTFKVAN